MHRGTWDATHDSGQRTICNHSKHVVQLAVFLLVLLQDCGSAQHFRFLCLRLWEPCNKNWNILVFVFLEIFLTKISASVCMLVKDNLKPTLYIYYAQIFDSSATAGYRLMAEMSMLELRERLNFLKVWRVDFASVFSHYFFKKKSKILRFLLHGSHRRKQRKRKCCAEPPSWNSTRRKTASWTTCLLWLQMVRRPLSWVASHVPLCTAFCRASDILALARNVRATAKPALSPTPAPQKTASPESQKIAEMRAKLAERKSVYAAHLGTFF